MRFASTLAVLPNLMVRGPASSLGMPDCDGIVSCIAKAMPGRAKMAQMKIPGDMSRSVDRVAAVALQTLTWSVLGNTDVACFLQDASVL